MNQAHSIVESYAIRGTSNGFATSSRQHATIIKSAKAAGKQREIRFFSTGVAKRSAWAAGQDVDGTSTQNRIIGDSKQRPSLPSSEKSVTVGGIADLKAKGEPM